MKSRAYYVFSVIMAFIFIISVTVLSAQFSGGTGTEDDPFIVANGDDLNNVRLYPDSFFRQVEDIDLINYESGNGWEPIDGFTGTYYGSGYTITNLIIDRPEEDNVGLFGNISGAVIGGLRLVDIQINGNDNVASLVGYSIESSITLSFASGYVEGKSNVGGLIGLQDESIVVECVSNINVKGSLNVGGLVGNMDGSSLENCYVMGNSEGESTIGGLVGVYDKDSKVIHCYAASEVSGVVNVGGLIGHGNGTTDDSYWDTEKSGQLSSAGGDGRTTAEMTYPYAQNTFIDWDVDFIWFEDESYLNDGYPYLIRIYSDIIPDFMFSGGNGTPSNPYLIEYAWQLNRIRHPLFLNRCYQQISDIELDDYSNNPGWLPIGTVTIPFSGRYNGNNYTIYNLYINRPNTDYIGLFGFAEDISYSGTSLMNINLSGIDVTGRYFAGGLAGGCSSTDIAFASSSGSIGGMGTIGGLIGLLRRKKLRDSHSSAQVSATQMFAGGLVGWNHEAIIVDCYALGDVVASGYIGGLIGYNNTNEIPDYVATIHNSFASGSVSMNYGVDGFHIGGLVGHNSQRSSVHKCYSYGLVNNGISLGIVGGLIGSSSGNVSTSYWDIETSGQTSSAGGNGVQGRTTEQMTYPYAENTYSTWEFNSIWLADWNFSVNNGYPYLLRKGFSEGSGTESDPWLIETVEHLNCLRFYLNVEHSDKHYLQTADINLGVLPWTYGKGWLPIGDSSQDSFQGNYNGQGYSINNLYINREGSEYNGLFGFIENAVIVNVSINDVNIVGQNYIGGLTGESTNSEIKNVSVTGAIFGNNFVGGMLGRINNDYYYEGFLSMSFSAVTVSGFSNIGGLVGVNSRGILDNCYSTGMVYGYSTVGGLIGSSNNGIVNHCYSTGEVDVKHSNGGGLVGTDTGSIFIYCYWDIEASGQSSSAGGIGRSTYEMLLSEDNYIGWTFDEENWQLVNPNDHIREAYPILYWQEIPEEYNYAKNSHIKLYHQGIQYYWESFPRLEYQGDHYYTVDLLEDLEDIVIQVESINYPHNYQIMVWDHDNHVWDEDEIGFIGKYGYQLKFSNYNQYDLYVKGPKLADDTVIELFPDSETWIGYFLRETQHAFDAFGDLLDDFVSIEGEHWSMRKAGGMWWHQSYPPPLVEYGKMYIVQTVANLSDPYLFSWSPPSGEEESFARRRLTEYFTFSDLPRYESIFIESIENDEDILEVAVYAGDDCVGASVFYNTYPLEILAYTGNHAEETLSFVIHRGGERGEAERVYVPQVMDPETGKYSPRILRPREQRFSIVRLGAQDEEVETIVKPEVILAQNYPNPMFWNNTASRSYLTQIPFYVSATREVTLSIYNIKGQLVKTLFTGTVNTGKHTIGWNGLNEHNRQVGSGVYFYLLETEDKQLTRKMLLIR